MLASGAALVESVWKIRIMGELNPTLFPKVVHHVSPAYSNVVPPQTRCIAP